MGHTRRKALAFVCLVGVATSVAPSRVWASEPVLAPARPAPGPGQAEPAPAPPPQPKRYAWTNNKWTGYGASLMSSGLVMAGGAGLALHAEPRPGNEDEDRFYHLLGIGLFCSSATSLVASPIITSIQTAPRPEAPLPSTEFFVGAATIAVGGSMVGIGTISLLGKDAHDSPWDDARGVVIATGAVVAAFGLGIALIGATDSGVPGARRPWQKGGGARGTSASLRVGPGSAFIAGEL